ncbi:leucine-rich repeat-containing protein 25 [Rhinatrema bivittatum]|uniref:leucine-rich repeat-containing protein 25 n=1 Tax=Rhinatrema bivittatum TaxID=194408 RepID=UPI00112BFDEF|nr:leucine-rich repeat-containing protein 25 [Rhinatrema bivittatum]
MRLLLCIVLILHNGSCSSGKCFNESISNCNSILNLSNKTQNCPTLSWSEFDRCSNVTVLLLSNNSIAEIVNDSWTPFPHLIRLDLSSNRLQHLPAGFLSQAFQLQELSLKHNNLQDLPNEFLKDSGKLKVLSLEGNPLPSISSSLFQANLTSLTVDCRCDITGSLVQVTSQQCATLNNTYSNCTNPVFRCVSSQSEWSNAQDFHNQQCQGSSLLALYICLPIVAGGILVGIAICCILKRKRAGTVFQSKEASSSMPSPSHSQPRYMARNTGGLSQAGPCQLQPQSKDYENVFVAHLQTEPAGKYECLDRQRQLPDPKSRKQMGEEDYYMECDANGGDQAIYCNTESAFYNNAKSFNVEDDDVYIMPDK